MVKKQPDFAEYIKPLNMNGLEGRMLRLPAQKKRAKREILFIYGQHSSIERWRGLAEEFSKFGNLTMPDLPGMGGMESFYKLGQAASIDNHADYLAAFMKLKFSRKQVTIIGMSLGFVIVTRMLQRHPELTKRVDMLVSIVGLAHAEDFIFSRRRHFFYHYGAAFFSLRLPAYVFRKLFLRPGYLRRVYAHSFNAKEKFERLSGDEFERTMDTEIQLWQINDIRSQMKTSYEMLTLDNTKVRVNLPVHHVVAKHDRYFNNVKVEEHMRRIFSDFRLFYSVAPSHAPTIVADAKTAAPFIPPALRKLLAKAPSA